MLQSKNTSSFASAKGHRTLILAMALSFGLASQVMGQARVSLAPVAMEVPDVVQRSQMTGTTDKSQVIHLSVNLAPANAVGLQAFVDSVSDPKSANYHNFITPKQVGQMFGQPQSVVDNVVNYLKSQGFKVTLVGDSHFGILADGTVGQAEAAFNISINNYHALNAKEPGRENFFSYSTRPQFPTSIAPLIVDVEGLQNFTKPRAMSAPLTPAQAHQLYSSASLATTFQGLGRHVAISNWDGYKLDNVPLFYKQFSLPVPAGGVGSNITVVTIDGGSGSGTAAGEGDLDIQMELGQAPLASMLIYDGGGNLTDVLTKEQNDNIADIISESWGWNLPASTAMAAHNIHLAMNAQGMTYMAAAGDSGTSLEPFSYPDQDPEVLSVGGTQPNVDAKGNRLSEPCWAFGGGGWSVVGTSFNVLPSWQRGKGVPTNINARLVPDVAFSASGDNGAFWFFTGEKETSAWGTSFASPFFGGALTIVEQALIAAGGLSKAPHRFGRIQDLIYSQNGRSDAWFDVTSGTNGTLPNGNPSFATAGWDTATGWGCMIMDGFVKAAAVTATIPFSPSSASVFSNTYINPSETEGNYISGSTASLAAVDQNYYVISPVFESAVGKVASISTSFSTKQDPTKLASFAIQFTASLPSQATAMMYIWNYRTQSYQLLTQYSGTAAGSANTLSLSGPYTDFMNSSGQVNVIVRSLVPLSKVNSVGTYYFKVDKLSITTSLQTN